MTEREKLECADPVIVTGGQYEGRSGTILEADENFAWVKLDGWNEEVAVSLANLTVDSVP